MESLTPLFKSIRKRVHRLGKQEKEEEAVTDLLQSDSLQTALLRLNPQTQNKMHRIVSNLTVGVIDELGCVPADMLHMDEIWRRLPAQTMCGDFYQCPLETQGRGFMHFHTMLLNL